MCELDKKADPNARDHFGYTLLHVSTHMGASEIVKLLLQDSVDVNAQAKKDTQLCILVSYMDGRTSCRCY